MNGNIFFMEFFDNIFKWVKIGCNSLSTRYDMGIGKYFRRVNSITERSHLYNSRIDIVLCTLLRHFIYFCLILWESRKI